MTGQAVHKNLTLTEGVLLKRLVKGLFCPGAPLSLLPPSCQIHNMEGGLLEGWGSSAHTTMGGIGFVSGKQEGSPRDQNA